MSHVKAEERFLDAAMDLYIAESALRELRRATKRCTEASKGDASIGDYGVPVCDTEPAYPDRCEACEDRARSRPEYLKLVSHRYMQLLNFHLREAGRATVTKNQFMYLLSILDRHQQRLLMRQFDSLEGITRG